ncbi:MAG: Gfo/Idh/MocA family oxidoreductase, partial [Oscillospiraceae bacterium]
MIKICVVGLGNIGKSVIETLKVSPDMEIVGIIRRNVTKEMKNEFPNIEVVDDVSKLKEKPDVAILCTPSRLVPETAVKYLALSINTVDSYDIHKSIYDVKVKLDAVAKENNA